VVFAGNIDAKKDHEGGWPSNNPASGIWHLASGICAKLPGGVKTSIKLEP
jgi:hypothetical protein